MPGAISNTSPLLYLYRIGTLEWLPRIFPSVWAPSAVVAELDEGRNNGYHVPDPRDYGWLQVIDPEHMPYEWFALDLGPGEIAAMALAIENPDRVVILDDSLARRTAQAAGLDVWGTLKILLAAKSGGLTTQVAPHVEKLETAGLWMSDDIRRRIIDLADE